MKKKKVKKVILMIVAVLCLLFAAGCICIVSVVRGSKVQVMDFSQDMNLKKPSLIKEEPTVLFLGNSMTYVNDLPTVFSNLSQSGGFLPDVYELTEGSYRLEYFADQTDEVGAEVYEALENYTWDYVILQEQSGIATMGGEEIMFPAARTLDSMVRFARGESVFLMTWAYKDGFKFNIPLIGITESKEEMQSRIAHNYQSIAGELDALLAPAGIAFMRCTEAYPDIELWDEDKSHPSLAGTYLAACVLYKVLYDQSPEGLEYVADLDGDTALKLQTVVAGIR